MPNGLIVILIEIITNEYFNILFPEIRENLSQYLIHIEPDLIKVTQFRYH